MVHAHLTMQHPQALLQLKRFGAASSRETPAEVSLGDIPWGAGRELCCHQCAASQRHGIHSRHNLKRSSFRTEFFPSRVVVFCSIIFKARGEKRKKKKVLITCCQDLWRKIQYYLLPQSRNESRLHSKSGSSPDCDVPRKIITSSTY